MARSSRIPATLYDGATHCFDGARLRAAILARGISAAEAPDRAGISENTLLRALRGERVSDRTVIRLYRLLEAHEPMQVAV